MARRARGATQAPAGPTAGMMNAMEHENLLVDILQTKQVAKWFARFVIF